MDGQQDRADRQSTARPHPRATDRVEDVVTWLLMSAGLVLLEAAASPTGEPAGTTIGVPARWIGGDGGPRTGRVEAMPGAPAGSLVPVWVNHDGTVTTPPPTPSDAWVGAALVGFDALLLGGAVIVGIWMGVHRLTALVNAAAWEREWAQVGPEWTGWR